MSAFAGGGPGFDREVVLANATGVLTATATLGPFAVGTATLGPNTADDLDLRGLDRFVGGPVPVDVTFGSTASQVRFVVAPADRMSSATFWAPVGLALFVVAYVESVLRPVRRRGRVRTADVAALVALGALCGAGLAAASWAMAGNVMPVWLALAWSRSAPVPVPPGPRSRGRDNAIGHPGGGDPIPLTTPGICRDADRYPARPAPWSRNAPQRSVLPRRLVHSARLPARPRPARHRRGGAPARRDLDRHDRRPQRQDHEHR
jgi:hypothetical protein